MDHLRVDGLGRGEFAASSLIRCSRCATDDSDMLLKINLGI